MSEYTIIWTPEKKDKAIEILTKYFSVHGVGECIAQSDEAIIESVDIMVEIADEVLVEGEGIVYIPEEED